MTPQAQQVLNYVTMNKTIRPLESLDKLGVYRLAAKIHELRNIGYNIKTTTVKVKNRFGNDCHIAEYSLG